MSRLNTKRDKGAGSTPKKGGRVKRNTGKDTAAVSMFNREHTVSRWIDSKPFKELLAA